MVMVPLQGYTPDLDPTGDGVVTACGNMIPTLRGLKAAPSAQNTVYPALAAECRGAAVLNRLDGQRRMFAGTAAKLYEGTAGTWTDVSRAVAYTTGAENRRRFAQFGNVSLCVNETDVLQGSTSGAFADIAGSPKARIIETVAGFVMLFATNDGVNDNPDGWWCSGLYDHTAWTPSLATQAANGRLLDSPGEIRAAKRLGSGIAAYKERSIYLGTYAGPPVIWGWQLIPGEIGALSQESVLDIGTAHLFIGQDDIWSFDGSRPVSIGTAVRNTFFADLHPSYRYRVQGFYDRAAKTAYWYYPSKNATAGAPDSCLVYHVPSDRWGRADRSIQACVDYLSASTTYDSFGTVYGTYDAGPDLSFDSPYWFAAGQTPAVVNASAAVQTLTGTGAASFITTGDVGDDDVVTTLTGIRPRFLQSPTTGTAQGYIRQVEGDTLLSGGTSASLYDGRFDLFQGARRHRARLDFTGDVEVTALDFDLRARGRR